MQRTGIRRVVALAVGALLAFTLAACGSDEPSGGTAGGGGDQKWVVGVSNTLVGNGWREEMICSVKAESLASGKVSKVVVANRNGGPTEQIADLRSLISQGVNAIIVNPSDREKLNPVIKQAKDKGIVVVAVDQAVSAPEAYVATNDQVAYGRLGGEWLAKALGGKGNVVEMRGIAGVPADDDRHKGFTEALAAYPDIKVVKEVFTGWDFSKGGQQALDLLNSSTRIDGIWTSGIDYTVVNAFETLNKPYVPIVGADNNEFLRQLRALYPGFRGAAVTNPATIGGVGAAVAIKVLGGGTVKKWTKLTPEVWDMANDSKTIKSYYSPKRPPTYSSQLFIKPWTTYTAAQLVGCKGP